MKKLFYYITCLIFISFVNQTHAISGLFASNNNLTTKEINQNIEDLKKQEENFINNDNYQKEYDDLKWFLKNNIFNDELEEINLELKNYIILSQDLDFQIKQNPLDKDNNESLKNQIIQEKINLYKFIYPYIDPLKIKDFKLYVTDNIKSSKQRKDLLEELAKNQAILDEKITNIKEKIENHKEDLNSKIDDLITSKIIERINQIDTNPKYKKISKETKNKIYSWFIENLNQRKQEINKSNLSENYKNIRIKILDKMIEEISQKIKK